MKLRVAEWSLMDPRPWDTEKFCQMVEDETIFDRWLQDTRQELLGHSEFVQGQYWILLILHLRCRCLCTPSSFTKWGIFSCHFARTIITVPSSCILCILCISPYSLCHRQSLMCRSVYISIQVTILMKYCKSYGWPMRSILKWLKMVCWWGAKQSFELNHFCWLWPKCRLSLCWA